MDNLVLVFPREEHEQAWKNIINEFENANERVVPYALKLNTNDYLKYLTATRNNSDNLGVFNNFIKSDTYFLMYEDQEKILGAVNIRHNLNENLLKRGGHIGYGIAPSERQKGYAGRLLKMALEKCRELSISEVLVTCDKANIGSAKTILKNGGVLENKIVEDEGNVVQRYWIKL